MYVRTNITQKKITIINTLQQSPSDILFRARSTAVAGMMARLLAVDTLLVQVHGGDTGQTAAASGLLLLLLRLLLRRVVLRRHRDWRQVLCVLVRLQQTCVFTQSFRMRV